jgi:hypothetical protein
MTLPTSIIQEFKTLSDPERERHKNGNIKYSQFPILIQEELVLLPHPKNKESRRVGSSSKG